MTGESEKGGERCDTGVRKEGRGVTEGRWVTGESEKGCERGDRGVRKDGRGDRRE